MLTIIKRDLITNTICPFTISIDSNQKLFWALKSIFTFKDSLPCINSVNNYKRFYIWKYSVIEQCKSCVRNLFPKCLHLQFPWNAQVSSDGFVLHFCWFGSVFYLYFLSPRMCFSVQECWCLFYPRWVSIFLRQTNGSRTE